MKNQKLLLPAFLSPVAAVLTGIIIVVLCYGACHLVNPLRINQAGIVALLMGLPTIGLFFVYVLMFSVVVPIIRQITKKRQLRLRELYFGGTCFIVVAGVCMLLLKAPLFLIGTYMLGLLLPCLVVGIHTFWALYKLTPYNELEGWGRSDSAD